MNAPDKEFLSREYNNRERVPEYPQFLDRWVADSARARATLGGDLDRRYGDGPGETIDVYPARVPASRCLMFIHGGYWRALGKNEFSFLAPAWVDAGVAVAVVNYDLCPQVSVEQIVRQMQRASGWLWRNAALYGIDRDRLYVAGHSAGGHLTAMLLSARWPAFDPALPEDLWKGGIGISGVYDLEPLLEVDWLNADLRLDAQSARALSPAFLQPATDAPLLACVGADETSEFLRQNALIARRWRRILAGELVLPGRHHFSVLDALIEPENPLYAGARRLMQLDP